MRTVCLSVLLISCQAQLHDIITDGYDINTYTKPVPLYARQAQRVSSGIAVPIFDPEGLVKATPRPLYFRDKDTVTDVQEDEGASGTSWAGLENFDHTGFRNSNSPELSQSPYLLRYPGSCYVDIRALTL